MDWLNQLLRPAVLRLKPYSSARHEAQGIRADIFLDANEMHYPPYGSDEGLALNRYGDPQPPELLQALATYYGVKPENILAGRGSDEGIDLLVRAVCREGVDSILICPPAFGMYKVAANIQGADVIEVPLNASAGYQHDVPAILKACTPQTKIIFTTTPHAPLGHAIRAEDILELCKARMGQSLIVADEAYVEFTDMPQGLIPHLKDYPNLVILRTMSKAHMLAGERIGVVIAQPAIIAALGKLLAAYPLPKTSVTAALQALSPEGLKRSAALRKEAVAERTRLEAAFKNHADVIKIYPSVTNFIFMEVKDATAFMAKATQAGIVLRNRSADLPNCVRLSVGTPEQNGKLLKAFGA